MKTDARVRYTKMRIEEVFEQLLDRKPISKITVKEICDLAEINRATFYKHYLDVYDLLEKQEDAILDKLRDYIHESENTSILLSLLTEMQAVERNRRITRMMENDPGFSSRISSVFADYYRPALQPRIAKYSPYQQEQITRFLIEGCSGVIRIWVKDGMRRPAQETAEFIGRLYEGLLSSL